MIIKIYIINNLKQRKFKTISKMYTKNRQSRRLYLAWGLRDSYTSYFAVLIKNFSFQVHSGCVRRLHKKGSFRKDSEIDKSRLSGRSTGRAHFSYKRLAQTNSCGCSSTSGPGECIIPGNRYPMDEHSHDACITPSMQKSSIINLKRSW